MSGLYIDLRYKIKEPTEELVEYPSVHEIGVQISDNMVASSEAEVDLRGPWSMSVSWKEWGKETYGRSANEVGSAISYTGTRCFKAGLS